MALLDELDDWDAACGILGDLDYEAQYVAIRSLLRRQRDADAMLEKEMDEIDAFARRTSGFRNEQAVEEWGVNFHISIFQSAAHSMAAAGMLAPFIESLFGQAFHGIRDQPHLRELPSNGHRRWTMKEELRWDCHFASPNRKHLVDGIFELAEATDLGSFMPADLRQTLDALFAYRNKMFHGGFEWPPDVRAKFATRIAADGWPADWFQKATHGDEPWVFYLSDEYVAHCLATIEAVLKGMGAFVRAKLFAATEASDSVWVHGHPDDLEK